MKLQTSQHLETTTETNGDVLVNTPHGPGKVFWAAGDEQFVRKNQGLAFVPRSLLEKKASVNEYQRSRYGEFSARCWPSIRVAHALPDLARPADLEAAAVQAFVLRLCTLLGGTPKV